MSPPCRHRQVGPGHRDRGSAAVEMVLLTPLLMLFLFLLVAAGRLVQARLEVDSAAQQAARADSLARDPASAAADATATAQSALASQHLTCDPVNVTPDLADFTPAGRSPSRYPAPFPWPAWACCTWAAPKRSRPRSPPRSTCTAGKLLGSEILKAPRPRTQVPGARDEPIAVLGFANWPSRRAGAADTSRVGLVGGSVVRVPCRGSSRRSSGRERSARRGAPTRSAGPTRRSRGRQNSGWRSSSRRRTGARRAGGS